MSFDYARSRSTATRLLVGAGQSLTLSKPAVGSYNPATSIASSTVASSVVTGVVMDYGVKEIDGKMVLRGDRKVMVSAGGAVPAIGDTLTIQSEAHRVIDVRDVAPGGVTILYIVQVRRGG